MSHSRGRWGGGGWAFKGTVSRDFFHESVSHQPKGIPLGPFQIFSNIRRDICKSSCKSRCTTGINDTGGKFATCIDNTGGKFCHQFCWYRWQICRWCQQRRWQLLPVSTTPVAIATGINDTGGKFATGVNDTGCKQWEQDQTADNLKWTWRKEFIYMVTLLLKGVKKK